MNKVRSFQQAALNGDMEKVRALLEKDPDPALSKDIDGATPWYVSAANGHKGVAELLRQFRGQK